MLTKEDGTSVEGGYTLDPDGQQTSIFEAAMAFQAQGVPLVVFGGEQYGAGSSRDWAAKGTALLGVKAVIAESFERIHRSNLVGMGVAPLQFTGNASWEKLKLDGTETISIKGLEGKLKPRQKLDMVITRANGRKQTVKLQSRIDTQDEVEYFQNGGILQFVLRQLAA